MSDEPIVDKAVDSQVHQIRLDDLVASEEFNCRGHISPIDVVDLWKSIEQFGLIQPIVIRKLETPVENKHYQLVAGFRRYWAHVVGKRDAIKATIIKCTQDEAEILNLSENIQRSDLNVLQEAKTIKRLIDKGWTQERICKELKMSRGWLQIRIKLLTLPVDIQQEAAAGLINQSHILLLYDMVSPEKQYDTVRKIKEAAERGEKLKTRALDEKKNIDPDVVPNKAITRKAMFEMIERIMIKCGPNLATRAIAYCAGEISENVFWQDVEEYKKGII